MSKKQPRPETIFARASANLKPRLSHLVQNLRPPIDASDYTTIPENWIFECLLGEINFYSELKSEADIIHFLVNKSYNMLTMEQGQDKGKADRLNDLQKLIDYHQRQVKRLQYLSNKLEEK